MITLTADVQCSVLHQIEQMLDDSFFVDVDGKFKSFILRFMNDFYSDAVLPDIAALFPERAQVPRWILEPGWLGKQVLKLRTFMASGDRGVLPFLRRLSDTLRVKVG